jgi:protein tyrosine phosphatase
MTKLTYYFVLDKEGKIYYDKNEPIAKHFDLIENNNLIEKEVAKLVYDPHNRWEDSDIGIVGVERSINRYINPLPFELTSVHLEAIEKFVAKNEEISEEYFEKDNLAIEAYLEKKKIEQSGKEKLSKLRNGIKQ